MKLKSLHIDSYKIFQNFDIDFCINSLPADIVVITGVNGTGKTTLLKEILRQGRETEIVYLPASQTDLDRLTSYISRYVDNFVYEKGKTSFEAYKEIQQMIDLIFEDFQLGTRFHGMNRDRELIFINNKGEQFNATGLSDGEKQILGKVFPLFTDEMNGKVVLMDEPEASLHPSWQTNLVPVLRRCAKENDCQFILATHSPHIISSVRSEELRLLIRTEDNNIESVSCNEGPYGWTVEKVLSEIQQVNHFRVPEIEEKLTHLRTMIERDENKTNLFDRLWKEMEETLGYSDKDLVLMRMEILRKKKKKHEES